MIHARIRKRFPAGSESSAFDLDVEFQAGDGVTVLFGASGAGKTLTLDSIAGFARPDAGRIMLDDRILFDGDAGVSLRPQARGCGYVFQNYALFPHMTLRENLAFAAERLPRLERHRRVNEMLERFRVADFAGRYPHEVSGGQKQRCSIARALIVHPRLLLLDEPARGMDAPLREDLYELLRELRGEFRVPILLVTHDLEAAFAVGDEMLVYDSGRIPQRGKPSVVLRQPVSEGVARLFGYATFLQADIVKLNPAEDSSVVRVLDREFSGPYFPGNLIGDRLTLCARPEELRLADGPGENRAAAATISVEERPGGVRLRLSVHSNGGVPFNYSVTVDVPRAQWEIAKDRKEQHIEFPPQSLRALKAPAALKEAPATLKELPAAFLKE
jgi:molybdate transport system ATP-binding protein